MARWLACTSAAALSIAVTTGSALAQSSAPGQVYAGGSIGTATYFDNDGVEFDYFGFVIAGQAGYRLTPNIRAEGELAYESTSGETDIGNVDVDVSVLRASVGAYYDFNAITFGGLTPYAGGGVGLTSTEVDFDGGGSDDDIELTAHVEAGGTLKLGTNLDLVPAARLETIDDTTNLQLRVGARFWF